MNIGNKLKELRLEHNLTQEELANRVELSKGFISQLENNLTSPSINTLKDILEVLGVSIADFFQDNKLEKVVFNEQDFNEKIDAENKTVINWVVPTSLKFLMEPLVIEIMPNGISFRDEPHQGEEFGYVLEGEVTLVLGNVKYKVKAFETFYYRANITHYLINNTNKKCRVLWISSPPMF